MVLSSALLLLVDDVLTLAEPREHHVTLLLLADRRRRAPVRAATSIIGRQWTPWAVPLAVQYGRSKSSRRQVGTSMFRTGRRTAMSHKSKNCARARAKLETAEHGILE